MCCSSFVVVVVFTLYLVYVVTHRTHMYNVNRVPLSVQESQMKSGEVTSIVDSFHIADLYTDDRSKQVSSQTATPSLPNTAAARASQTAATIQDQTND